MKTFSAKATIATEMTGQGMQTKQEMHVTITANSSGKYRMESTSSNGMLTVFDGDAVWLYMPQYKKYQKFSLKNYRSNLQMRKSSGITIPVFFAGDVTYGTVADNVQRAHVLRSQTLHVAGALIPCWVVSVEYEPEGNHKSPQQGKSASTTIARTTTLWVQKAHYLVYRDHLSIKVSEPGAAVPETTTTSIKFSAIKLNKPVPKNTFTFTPPPDSTNMHLSGLMPKMPATK